MLGGDVLHSPVQGGQLLVRVFRLIHHLLHEPPTLAARGAISPVKRCVLGATAIASCCVVGSLAGAASAARQRLLLAQAVPPLLMCPQASLDLLQLLKERLVALNEVPHRDGMDARTQHGANLRLHVILVLARRSTSWRRGWADRLVGLTSQHVRCGFWWEGSVT